MTRHDDTSPEDQLPEGVIAVRFGPGANCSSIGSVVDILFVSATLGGALLTTFAALSSPKAKPTPAPSPASSPSIATTPACPPPPEASDD